MAEPKYALPAGREKKDVQKVMGVFGSHSFLTEEQGAFVEHINVSLSHDDFLKERGYLPISREGDGLYVALSDGIVLSKLINYAVPETIDERALNFPAPGKELNAWEKKENQNVAINSAKSIGCQVVNIGATDMINAASEHKEYLVLGLIWQIVKIQLMAKVDIKNHPEIYRLLAAGEELPDLLKLPPEEVLLRWLNFHVKRDAKITNFGEALKDCTVYAALLHSIDSAACPHPDAIAALEDPAARAAAVIEAARAMEVPVIVQPGDITSGNRKLNLAFVAAVFNTRHGLDAKDEAESAALAAQMAQAFESAGLGGVGDGPTDSEDDAREERVFRMWMNSLNLAEGAHPTIINLMSDLADGVAIVETGLAIAGEEVTNWMGARKLNRGTPEKPLNKFKSVENCNMAVEMGQKLGLSLTGIGGVDILNKNTKLVLAYVWQLMRLQLLSKLRDVGGGKVPKDGDIVDWANATVAAAGASQSINSFKDSSIGSGTFLLALLAAVEPRAINPALVTPGETEEERRQNAKYVISVARKIGATVYLTWEDIVEVKHKMVMMLVASVMHKAMSKTTTE